ncbi:hypothetical protein L207DRAFT_17650 [Hyaloscypha variabilis F]|uniref:Uncharacterized protein n=1 Tax=Hyaloscypha variabilis (strain UAMH 11265 / GT02V1 / F) TaxID=1149755 RepID=A0A2J6SDH3_HYAVF|nr:hypothetical protein L207DRAFT_17650 [Hyaloscypha variabilis F]
MHRWGHGPARSLVLRVIGLQAVRGFRTASSVGSAPPAARACPTVFGPSRCTLAPELLDKTAGRRNSQGEWWLNRDPAGCSTCWGPRSRGAAAGCLAETS